MKKALKIFLLALDMAITWPFRLIYIIVFGSYVKIRYKLTITELLEVLFLSARHGIRTNGVFVEEGLGKAVEYYEGDIELD